MSGARINVVYFRSVIGTRAYGVRRTDRCADDELTALHYREVTHPLDNIYSILTTFEERVERSFN